MMFEKWLEALGPMPVGASLEDLYFLWAEGGTLDEGRAYRIGVLADSAKDLETTLAERKLPGSERAALAILRRHGGH